MAEVTNMTTTLGEMVEQVYFFISENNNGEGGLFKESEVKRAINTAFSRIVKKINKNITDINTTISAGSRRISIPDGIIQNGNVLIDTVFIDGEAITAAGRELDDGTSGEPSEYYVDGNSIVLMPRSDSTYTLVVSYRREHKPLSEDTDTVTISDTAIDAAVKYACYMMKLKDEEYSAADRFKAEWEDAFKEFANLQSGVYKANEYSYGGAV